MINENTEPVRLTQYSHGAGCGCKISPKVLDEILASNFAMPDNDKLIVAIIAETTQRYMISAMERH